MHHSPSPPPLQRASGLPNRRHQLPSRYRDELPALPIPVPIPPPVDDAAHAIPHSPIHSDSGTTESEGNLWVHTEPDMFGTFRSYRGTFPSYDPEITSSFDGVCDSRTFQQADAPSQRPWYAGIGTAIDVVNHTFFAPFLNATTFRLMNWFYESSSGNSLANVDRLVQGVILADDFEREDLRNFSAFREAKRMDQADEDPDSKLFSTSDKWHEASVKIKLPGDKHKYASESDAPECAVDGLYYWKPLEVIKSAYEEVGSKSFHNVPYKLFWQPDEGKFPERIITEVYTANAMLDEHEKIKAQPREPGCQLETVVASIMLWSDSTHLASFGHAALWPIYMFIGNQSKYIRNCPSAFAAHHLAYIPKVCICFAIKFSKFANLPSSYRISSMNITTNCMGKQRQVEYSHISSENLCKPFGCFFWTKNSCTHMNMVLWCGSLIM